MTWELPTIPIAGTSVRVCRLGFGCSRLFGAAESRASARLIEAALEAGIRHFDTAPLYGAGDSERVLGSVTSGMRDVTITTKAGFLRPAGRNRGDAIRSLYRRFARPVLSRFPALKSGLVTIAGRRRPPANLHPPARVRLAPEEVVRQLEESLECLRRERVDIYLLHEPDRYDLGEELEGCFRELQARGLVGAFGVGYDRTAEQADSAFGSVLQARYVDDQRMQSPAATRIFHGVLRQSPPGEDPATRIAAALRTWPGSAVIFSASAPFQIRQVAEGASRSAAAST